MEKLMKISEVVDKYDLTTRTLRYYEDMGLVESIRSDGYAYRMYDDDALQRIEEILVFRKLEISIKEIQEIYASDDRDILLDILKEKVEVIEDELDTRKELRDIIKKFIKNIERKGRVAEKNVKALYEASNEQEVFDDHKGNRSETADYKKLNSYINRIKNTIEYRIVDESGKLYLSTVCSDDEEIINAVILAVVKVLKCSRAYEAGFSKEDKITRRPLGVKITEKGELDNQIELIFPVRYSRNLNEVYVPARGKHASGLDIRIVESNTIPVSHNLVFLFDYKNRKHYYKMKRKVSRYLKFEFYETIGRPVEESKKRFCHASGLIKITVPIKLEENLWFK